MFAALVCWLLYRRLRRNFGRQPLRPARMILRMILFIGVAATLAPAVLLGRAFALAAALGAVAGIALASWGASRTRFLRDEERLFYFPHTYTGIAVSALLLGRILYRLTEVYSAGGLPAPGAASPGSPIGMVKTPLTLGLFWLLIGYYVCYYGRVLWRSKRLTPADLETAQRPPQDSATDASHLAR